ncbi:MAG: uL22 family ribosomal protein [Candidatus Microgenomates bacterium]|jgi:large subunit ribosomal protein L22
MEIIATQKYILVSPKKLRPIADMAKKLKPSEAIARLPFIGKMAAADLIKVIKTAIANGVNRGIAADTLIFKEIQIGEGPRLKRGQPVSRGQWHPIKKRMAHIRVILQTIEKSKVKDQKARVKGETKNGTKN